MTTKLPNDMLDLLQAPNYVTLATIQPDGTPQLSIVWCDCDGDHIYVNTARERRKELNMRHRPKVSILSLDPQNPYRYIEIRGIVELIEEGADAHIDSLAKAYDGVDGFYGGSVPAELKGTETRVICKITPMRVRVMK